jgi:CelD/BcsL family acetyltransferase involved in cellulose biosynthesis
MLQFESHDGTGHSELVDITDIAAPRGASRDAANARAPIPLTDVSYAAWRSLSERAIEPNGYYLPDWELAVNASAPGRTGASALVAADDVSGQMLGLMPVVSLRRAYQIPLPALVSAHPYGTLCTPQIDCEAADDAVGQLIEQARQAGAHALILREISLDGTAKRAFGDRLGREGLHPIVLQSHVRASLDATRDAEDLLRDALGGKKLKELRRQRQRLAEHGKVRFEIARSAEDVASALETFLMLEAGGWKGKRGTALIQVAGDAAFIRRATRALAGSGQCEIVTLHAGDNPVASGIVLRHQGRAFFFKLGVDERFAKCSPGVQLTLDLTRHLCADPAIASADSTAGPDHPMINPIWRGRFAIGDVLIPLRPNDPVVTLIHSALASRQFVFETARGAVRFIRNLRRKSA